MRWGGSEVRGAQEISEKSPKIRKYSLSKGSQCVTAPSHRWKWPNSREKPAVMPFWGLSLPFWEDPKVIHTNFIQAS
jgi:hypothetical protein